MGDTLRTENVKKAGNFMHDHVPVCDVTPSLIVAARANAAAKALQGSGWAKTSEHWNNVKGTPAFCARQCARKVLPQPDGPMRTAPNGKVEKREVCVRLAHDEHMNMHKAVIVSDKPATCFWTRTLQCIGLGTASAKCEMTRRKKAIKKRREEKPRKREIKWEKERKKERKRPTGKERQRENRGGTLKMSKLRN